MKTCAIVDFFSVHDHIIPSHIGYLQQLGYHVTVFSPTPNFREVTKLLPNLSYDVVEIDPTQYQGGRIRQLRDRLRNHFPLADTLCGFDLVLLNTFRTELQITSVIAQRCPKVLAIMHTPHGGLLQPRYRVFESAGHQALVLSSAMGKAFDLPWFCALTYADEGLVRPDLSNTKLVFCVPGTVRFTGRTYRALVDSVKKLNAQGIDGFLIKIVGRIDKKDGLDFLQAIKNANVGQYFSFVSDVSHERFLLEVASSDFVLPLIDKFEEKRGDRHYNRMITSSVFLAIGMGKKLVCEKEFADTYRLGEAAITHSGQCLEAGLIAAITASEGTLRELEEQVKDLRSNLLSTSAQNLDQAIRKLR